VIHNAARFGNTVIRAAEKLHNDVLRKNPDIVVIEFGGNDCDFNWEAIAQNPLAHHEPNTDLNTFQNMLRNLIEQFRKSGIVPVLLTLPPIDAERYFKWISRNSSQAADMILTWLGSVSKIYWWQERYNSAIISIARETKTRWIDIRSAFLSHPDFTQFICKDGIHPNEQGHIIIAEKIIEYIKSNYRFLLTEGNPT
jgi:lysophospholipase L1-like esterase